MSIMDCYAECPLHWLVCSDDYYRQFRARLEDPNERDDMGFTLLHVAAQSPIDNSKIVQLLLDRGADVNSATRDGHTPLHYAVSMLKLDTVVALTKAGASVNSKDILGRTALHFSVCKGQSSLPSPVFDIDCDKLIVDWLLCHSEINVNPVDQMGDTPLMWAVKKRHSNAVCALLKKGACPNISNKDQRTPLHEALSTRNPDHDIVTCLLTNGASIYSEDNSQQTPMDIFVCNARDMYAVSFSAFFVWLIAFRYHIRKCLKHKLEQIPYLYNYLNGCCKEVRLMRKIIVYDNVTLHDFALDCFQMHDGNPVRKIYIPVVKILLAGLFKTYFECILNRLSVSDLRSVLKIMVGKSIYQNLLPPSASNLTIYHAISHFYGKSVERKRRLLGFELFRT